jgi:hypothetical protein
MQAREIIARPCALEASAVLRVAKNAWRRDGGKFPLAKYLRESFATLEKEI